MNECFVCANQIQRNWWCTIRFLATTLLIKAPVWTTEMQRTSGENYMARRAALWHWVIYSIVLLGQRTSTVMSAPRFEHRGGRLQLSRLILLLEASEPWTQQRQPPSLPERKKSACAGQNAVTYYIMFKHHWQQIPDPLSVLQSGDGSVAAAYCSCPPRLAQNPTPSPL